MAFRFRDFTRALLPLIVMAAGCTTMQTDDPERFRQLVDNPIRTDQDRRMDVNRRPTGFLAFTGAKPGMQLLDVSAGGGYTTQLMALAVGPGGKVWAQRTQPGDVLTKRLAEHPQPNIEVVIRPFEDPIPPNAPKFDLITLVNNYHDITYLPVDRAKMNQALFAALKPGGRFVVVDHAAKAGSDISVGKTLHRIDEALVLDEVRKAGFVLDAKGDFARNADDTREKSSGDANIPTDRFALRFVKP